jgi:hypothetical protein
MIEDYNDILNEWAVGNSPTATVPVSNIDDAPQEWSTPCQDGCSNMMEVIPAEDFTRWAVQRVVTVLANSDYYYTKAEVDHLIEMATASAVTRAEVEQMINTAIATKADKAVVDALAEQVRQNTERLFNTYTKSETNSLLSNYLSKLEATRMRDNYSKVEGETLILNSEFGITI